MEINENRVNQYIRSFEKALTNYQYDEPLSRYLTRFFKENKQMGSSDRRMTSRFCYNFFRLGNSLKGYSTVERLTFAEFLCTQDSPLIYMFKPELIPSLSLGITAKLEILSRDYGFDLKEVFPLIDHISEALSENEFLISHFIQPDLFIRIRRGKEDFVKNILHNNEIDFCSLSATTFAIPNGTNLQKLLSLEGLYEVQDLSSQQTIEFITANPNENWWDACAASGGKALMFLDKYPTAHLLVSDIRLSILRILDERFEKAGITSTYRKKILDLSLPVDHLLQGEEFDGIILDVPCSGSGTWGRTPEMIQQIDVAKLNTFTTLQKDISSNAIPYLKKGGSLIYITCSIYRDENEDVVAYLLANFDLDLQKKSVLKGYENKADSMFAAHFIKR